MPAQRPPDAGIYFRKGHFDDRLIDGLITVRISVALVTPLGVEEKEMTFSATDILSAIQAMLAVVTNLGLSTGLPVSQALGGNLPSASEQRAMQRSALAGEQPA